MVQSMVLRHEEAKLGEQIFKAQQRTNSLVEWKLVCGDLSDRIGGLLFVCNLSHRAIAFKRNIRCDCGAPVVFMQIARSFLRLFYQFLVHKVDFFNQFS